MFDNDLVYSLPTQVLDIERDPIDEPMSLTGTGASPSFLSDTLGTLTVRLCLDAPASSTGLLTDMTCIAKSTYEAYEVEQLSAVCQHKKNIVCKESSRTYASKH